MSAWFAGYASLFDTPDLGQDSIAPGAFAQSLRQRPRHHIRMLYQHNVGCPIGVWHSIAETARGLWVEGELTLDSDGGRNAFALLKAGALDGLSIGYTTTRARRLGSGRRRLLAVELFEVSLVTFPMQPNARVMRIGRSGTTHALASAIGQAARHIAAGASHIAPLCLSTP